MICTDTLGPHGGGVVTINDAGLQFTRVDPYAAEIADFAAAVAHRREPEVGGAEAVRNVEIIEAAGRPE